MAKPHRPLVKAALCAAALVALAALSTACNTVEGFGKDVEGAGKAIQGE